MKSSQTRVRVNQDNTETLRKLAEQTGLQQIDVATMLLHSALTAIREYSGPVPMVVKFKIDEGRISYAEMHLNERGTSTQKRK